MNEILDILSFSLLFTFIGILLIRVLILKRKGINTIVFGETDKSDFLLVPIMLFFIYTILAALIPLPYPHALITPLIKNNLILYTIGLILSVIGILMFIYALISFGNSFRVGIDDKKPGELIKNGFFAVSRNPIYVSFFFFFIGMAFIHPNIALISIITFIFIPIIHRQVLREEKSLKKFYGEEYLEYLKKVPRYL